MATRKELREKNQKFKQEIYDLYLKEIKVVDISELKKITRARVYQIIDEFKPKTDDDCKTA